MKGFSPRPHLRSKAKTITFTCNHCGKAFKRLKPKFCSISCTYKANRKSK